jgi:hypothetical protein
MLDAPEFGVCPRCGGGPHAGGLTSAVLTCRECGTSFRPAAILDGTGPDRLGRLVPADRAAAVVRAVAEEHRAPHIVKQLDGIRSDRVAKARARFARGMTDDEVSLVLVDTSFMRNGRSGFLLTNRALYSSRLPEPIRLDEIDKVQHRPPAEHLSLLHIALVVVHVVFPPAVLLLLPFLPLVYRKRERTVDALLVNDRVVFAGKRNLVWDFWVDVLIALRTEFDTAPGPALVVVLESVHQGAEGAVVANPRTVQPTWAAIETAIQSLDGWANPAVVIWAGPPARPAGLEVRGGVDKYALRELPAGWVYHDPAGLDEEVEVSVGQMGYRCPAHAVCTDVGRVLAIVRRFTATGAIQ